MTCSRPPRGELWEMQTHHHPACAWQPLPQLCSPCPSPQWCPWHPRLYTPPTDPQSGSLYTTRWDLMKHRVVFWPQGKGTTVCTTRPVGGETCGGRGCRAIGARWPDPSLYSSRRPSCSLLPIPSRPAILWLFTYPVYLPNSAQNFRITRHLTSHLNPSSRCCPQTGSRAITWRLFEMQRPGLHPQTSQIRVCFKTGGSPSDLHAQWSLKSTSLHCQRLEATVYIIPEHARIPLTGNQVARPPFHPGTSKACVCVCVCMCVMEGAACVCVCGRRDGVCVCDGRGGMCVRV